MENLNLKIRGTLPVAEHLLQKQISYGVKKLHKG